MCQVEPLSVLYRDDVLFVVNKPHGLAVHRGFAHDDVFAADLARQQAGQPVFAAHRLDRATSGVLVFSLDSNAARVLELAFRTGWTDKRYLTLVRGITPDAGVVDHPIAKDKHKPARPAVTEYVRLATFERYSLLEAHPLTGRLHQIRRHLKHISHPIIGDVRHGRGDQNRIFRERFGLHRLALHAFRLTLPHPVQGRPVTFAAPVPPDLVVPLERMGFGPDLRRLEATPR